MYKVVTATFLLILKITILAYHRLKNTGFERWHETRGLMRPG